MAPHCHPPIAEKHKATASNLMATTSTQSISTLSAIDIDTHHQLSTLIIINTVSINTQTTAYNAHNEQSSRVLYMQTFLRYISLSFLLAFPSASPSLLYVASGLPSSHSGCLWHFVHSGGFRAVSVDLRVVNVDPRAVVVGLASLPVMETRLHACPTHLLLLPYQVFITISYTEVRVVRFSRALPSSTFSTS
ncbi:uncharacterized protein SCHCODRAFT_02484016 [Schizophyllum commune H4-8]|uniref:Expressed protein n=1 Tax=Schizophyllum commune (strain H4-8 / FGSC 9210) TaxID=578458 RepID=D8PT49_SCHCM|nr:uncharacterized protein SCHCODRAFT_02484016 [Schizophyllum commune H4-8]KAI5899435.1 hypothetical protein SCHCODRAFT_02484016 [Schizophyllum commune H4-8]